MEQLNNLINDKNNVLSSSKYINEDPAQQSAYTSAIANAEAIKNKTQNPELEKDTIQQAINQINSAINNLHGEAKLAKAKQDAQATINALNGLTNAQKANENNTISTATTRDQVSSALRGAQALDQSMQILRDLVNAKDQVQHSSDYINEDAAQQSAYNNAINNGESIIRGQQNPTMNKTTIDQAINQINNAKNELHGANKLQQAKNEANQTINQLGYLNDPQKTGENSLVNGSTTRTEVANHLNEAKALNNSMKGLRDKVAESTTVKQSSDYINETPEHKNAYDQAVQQAQAIINESGNPTLDKSAIDQKLQNLTNAQNALHGANLLDSAKNNAISEINKLSALNDAQRQKAIQNVQAQTTIPEVNQQLTTDRELNNAMQLLRDAVNQQTQVHQQSNYFNEDQQPKNNYDSAIQAGQNIINKTQDPVMNKDEVEQATNQINTTKNALAGENKLRTDQQHGNAEINGLTSLNPQQISAEKDLVNQATTRTQVAQNLASAKELNAAMKALRDGINDKDEVKRSSAYINADPTKISAYDQALQNAENIINATPQVELNKDKIQQALTRVQQTQQALDGVAQLSSAKQSATQSINGLTSLNDGQKRELNKLISNADTRTKVQGQLAKANELNTAMKALRDSIQNTNQVKQSSDYINEDQTQQRDYNNAVNNAETTINNNAQPVLDKAQIEQLTQAVKNSENALHGTQKLNRDQQTAETEIRGLTSLNEPQKNAEIAKVKAATTRTEVNQILESSRALNTAMHGLRESIKDKTDVKNSSKYINEDQPEQQAYDNAVNNAQQVIDETQATLDKNTINNLTNAVTQAKSNLHGDVKLQQDKDSAKQTISQLPNLNDAQKHMEDSLIDSQQTRTNVTHDLTEAQALNGLMGALKESVKDNATIISNGNYINAESTKKQAYDQAVQHAQDIINGTNQPTINKGDISRATQTVNNTKTALDGNHRLEEAQQNANQTITNLPNLNNAQKTAEKQLVNQSNTLEQVQQHLQTAQALDNAMGALRQSIANKDQVKSESKYLNEDPTVKANYDQAVQRAEDIINATQNPELNKGTIEQATQAVQQAEQTLHGVEKLNQDKTTATNEINGLTNLTDAQREKLKELISNSDSRDDIKQKIEQAKQLNNAMEQLKHQVGLKDNVHSSSNYYNEDPAQKQAYDDAIKRAEDIIKNTNDPSINPQDIIKALNDINKAKDNLHGEQRLQSEKDTSNSSIDQMSHLNQPQKDALKQAINGATTREQVAEKLKEAEALDNAMKQLEDQVNQDPTITSSSKYENEDTDQQKAYNNAIKTAKDIINQTSNPTLDKNKIEEALHNIQNAVNNLHGEQKLEQAKQQANDQLNHLNELTNEQKEHFRLLINNADTRTEVQKQLDIAKQLNSDMSDIKDQIAKQDKVHQTGNYVNADDATKQAYDNAVKEAKDLINNNPGTLDHRKLQKLINKIDDAQNALNGQSRFDTAQKEALKELGTLNSLNQPQRKRLEDNLNNATTLDGLAQVLQQAKELNKAMKAMRDSIQDQDQVRQSSNYTNADPTQQQAYNNAVNNINNIITETSATMDPQSINQATQALESAKQALNGVQKLQDDKNSAKQEIGNLPGLTDTQKHALDEAINQLTHRPEISKKLKDAKFLNNEMEALKAAVAKAPTIRQTSNYINEDTPQKEAYDNVIKKGQAIIDAQNNPTMSGSDIINIIQEINNAEHGLHGEQKLQQAKNNAINEVYGLDNLNRAQIAKEVQDIQASTTRTAVEQNLEQAKVLNQAMKELKQSIADKNETLNSSNYINEDPDKKLAYDNAVSKAEQLLNQQSDPTMNPSEINAATQKVNETKAALHGADKLTQSQNESNETINHLPNLNDKQKQALNNLINQATTKQKVAEIINQSNQLNSEMGKLKSLVEQQPSVHKQSNYLNEDPEVQNIYDNAIQSGQDIINGNTTDVLDKNNISNIIQNIELAKGDLHGEQKLQKAQQEANDEINQLSNLNDPQRQEEHNEINNAPSRTEVQSDLNNAKALNEAMRQLENEVHLENTIKQSSNYINENQATQNAYNDALQKAKDIINAVPDKTLDKTTIEQALNQLQHAGEALHGEQKLQEAKDQANEQIDRLDSLNPGQVLAEKTLVNQAQTLPGVQEALQKAKELNAAMKALRAEVAKENQVKTESKYINADHPNQINYDSAINQGSQIITTTQPPELNKDLIDRSTQAIIDAQNNLNGEAKLTEAKSNGNQEIDHLDGLTQAQKDKERELINQAPTKAQVNDIINNANQLNESMKQLQQAINNADDVKQSSDYVNEDPTQQDAYNKAIQAAKDLINAQPPTMDKAQIDRALANVNQALNNLHGSDKLTEAKKEASTQLNNLNNLTNGQHDKLVDNIFNELTRTQVAQVVENAKQLNNTMKALRDSIADNEQVLHSSKYINEDPEQKAAYNQAVTKAKNIINDNSSPTLSNSEVQNIVNEVTQAKDNLHGDQKLATDKTNAKATLDNLTHLNHAQRHELEEEIHDATTRPGVQDVVKLANQLNDAMKKLEDALAGNEAVKQTSNYINEDTAQKGNYDNYVNQAKQIVAQQDNPNMSPENINEVTQKLEAAKNDLHGEQKLEHDKQQATENINQMTSLNQAQKDALNHEIQQAQIRPEIIDTVNKAKPLDAAMKKLRQSIADANDIKQTSNYINKVPSIQNAYDNAVDHAQQIIDQTSNPTMDPLEIDRDTSNVQTAKNNLHGERVLNDDKRPQTNAVNHLDNLNQAQKDALTHEIAQATRVPDVNNVYNKAKALDSEMQKLKDIVAQQNSVRKSSNYVNEDSAAQQAYNDAITDGQAIIDQTTQPTMSHDEIENAINKIKQKVAALDGEHKLQEAKENANNLIDSLNNLNTPQKNAEKGLINGAKTRDKVTQQTHTAQELNDAMGQLRNSIQDQATIRQESRYINENEDKQQAYNHAVTDAENVINEHNPTLNKDTIDQLTQQVNQAKGALNGVELLNADKQTAHQTIPTLNHLNTAQQQAFNDQIDNAPTRAKVQQIVGQADVLNNMMKALEDSIKDKDQVKNSSDYINEDPNEQQAYDNAVANVENILHQTTQPIMSVSDIQNAIDNVRNAKNNLHGQNKLTIAKDEAAKQLRKLTSLTTPQSGEVAKQIYGADTRTEVRLKL